MKNRFATQVKTALEEQKKARRLFKSKRKTVLVRIQKKWHLQLRQLAQKRNKTMSKLHDEIYPPYFNRERN